ncbi:MAG: hypothetical protein GYA24_24235 [Candidatus Lokiarchaeota archaeon]|nr:hypothetical protein [Candidatus Lokiarchaeota archaeon]
MSSRITTFLAEWDENAGPKIVDAYPASKKIDLEDITMQIFTGFQTVFGTSDDVAFDRTNLVLPLKSHKVMAKILLDSYRSKKVRGGRLPFIVAFLVPVKFYERELHVYNDIQERIVDQYAKTKTIELKAYFDEIVEETESLAMKTREKAESLLKKKEYWESVEEFRNALFLLKLTKNTDAIDETLKKMEAAITRYSKEILDEVNGKIKEGNWTQAEKDHLLTVRLAKEVKNEKIIGFFTGKLNDFYASWIKVLEKDAKAALKGKEADPATARAIQEKIVKIAQKTKIEKLIKKHEKNRDKNAPQEPEEEEEGSDEEE